jgi:hypothetical protein
LLDTSKGWTLDIPGPDESDGAAARMIAAQEHKAAAAKEIASSAGAVPVGGSR